MTKIKFDRVQALRAGGSLIALGVALSAGAAMAQDAPGQDDASVVD